MIQPRSIIILVVTGLIFFFLCTWFANWYLKKLYGKHLAKLETVLRELNSSTD
jgi:hypothetical protein